MNRGKELRIHPNRKQFIMSSCVLHEALKPLAWLQGKWKSVSAKGFYPTMKPFEYSEEISFTSVGQPGFIYSGFSKNIEKNTAMHLENGFLRIDPGTNNVALILAHSFGLTTLEEGVVDGKVLHLKNRNQTNRMSFSKGVQVLSTERCYRLKDNDELHYIFSMETANTPLTEHLDVTYKRIS